MIVWGGRDATGTLNDGARYDPVSDHWTPLATANAPAARYRHTAIWTGSEMIVWGGWGVGGFKSDGARYNPATDSWMALPTDGAPVGRESHTAIWTGTEMIIWGGSGGGSFPTLNNGARYNPTANRWEPLSTADAPSGRYDHTAIWTGSDMIVWGGEGNNLKELDDGGRYSPLTDEWMPLTSVGAPSARTLHTAVWTGSEMIVWGGQQRSIDLGDGACYNPATDTGHRCQARPLHLAIFPHRCVDRLRDDHLGWPRHRLSKRWGTLLSD